MPRSYRRRRNPRTQVQRAPTRIRRRPGMTIKKAVRYASYIPPLIKTVQQIKGLVNSEYKHLEYTPTLTPTTSGTMTQITQIAQGDQANQREGRSVLLKSLLIRGTITQDVNDTSTYNMIRMIIFQTKNDNDAPTVAKLLDGSATYLDPLNLDYSHNVRILNDKVFRLYPKWSGDHQQIFFKRYFKLNTHCQYDGTGSTQVKAGNLWVALVSDVASYGPSVLLNMRMRYTDN